MSDWIEDASQAIYEHIRQKGYAPDLIAEILRRHAPPQPKKVLAISWSESDGSFTRLAAVEYRGEFIETLLKRYADEYAFDPTKLKGTIFEIVPIPSPPAQEKRDE